MKKIIFLAAMCAITQTLAANAIVEQMDMPQDDQKTGVVQPAKETKLSGKLLKKEIFSLSNRVESRKNAPVKVEVITSQDIENQNSPVLTTLMNQISGVTVQQTGAMGDKVSFRLRGTDRVRVLIDGVRADSLNENKFYLQDYMSDDFERIEVVKGPAGNMGGSQASGGLIGLFTKRGYGEPSLKLQSDMGGYGTFRERASFSGSTEKTDYYLSTTFLKTDGGARYINRNGKLQHLKNDDYKNFNVAGNFGYKLFDNKAEIRNITRVSNSKKSDGINYNWTLEDYNNYSKNLNFLNTSIFDYAPNEMYDSSTRLGIFSQTFNLYTFEDDPISGPDYRNGNYFYRGNRLNFVTQHNFNYKDFNKFSIGYNLEYEKYGSNSRYSEDKNPYWHEPAYSDRFGAESLQNDIFVNDSINIKDILFLRGGARFSHNSIFGNFISPNASAAVVLPTFKLNGAYSKFRGSWGQATNVPSLYQRFGQDSSSMYQIGNPNLRKEQFEGWDLGFEQAFFNEKLTFDFGYFNNKYKDYIDFLWSYPSMYVNINRAKINGYEGTVSWQPNEKFRASFNYTYTHSEDLTTGNPLLSTPNNRVNLALYYTPSDKLTLYTSAAGSTDRVYTYQYGSNAPLRTGGFVDVNFGGKIKLYENKRAKAYLTAQIFNLLNQKISMYRGAYHPGISCLIGLNLEFKTKGQWL